MSSAIVTHESGFFGRTPRPDRFQEMIGNVVRPAQIRADRAGRYDFRANHVRFERMEVTVLSYGDPVEIDLPEVDPAAPGSLVLQLVLSGSAQTQVDGGDPVQQSSWSAHLASSDLPLRVRCHRDCRHFLVRMDRRALEHAAREFQQDIAWPDPRSGLSLATPGGRALRRYIRYLVGEIHTGGRRDLVRYVARATEQSLFAHVVAALQSPTARAHGAKLVPHETTACVRRAVAFIEARLQDDIGLREIVSSSGTSLRSLYRAFERLRGTTPMAYLRDRRFECAHAELVAADPRAVRVTDVALRWGFPHLSDFALRYRERYGCPPSQTLRRH
jgi:AraC-like DNA-binding protein